MEGSSIQLNETNHTNGQGNDNESYEVSSICMITKGEKSTIRCACACVCVFLSTSSRKSQSSSNCRSAGLQRRGALFEVRTSKRSTAHVGCRKLINLVSSLAAAGLCFQMASRAV